MSMCLKRTCILKDLILYEKALFSKHIKPTAYKFIQTNCYFVTRSVISGHTLEAMDM